MKKVFILSISFLFISCFTEPKKEVSDIDSIDISEPTTSTTTDKNVISEMSLATLEFLMLKTNIDFMSWVKDNGYECSKNDSEYHLYQGVFFKKDKVISFDYSYENSAVEKIIYLTNNKKELDNIEKNFTNESYNKDINKDSDTTNILVISNNKYLVKLSKMINDSLQYKISIENYKTK